MLVNTKLYNFCCNVLGKYIIKSKFFSYYDKLKLIARCSFQEFLFIPDLFEKFNFTYLNTSEWFFIYVTTVNYDDFLNKYLNKGYDINQLKIFLLIGENQKYDDKPYLYKFTKNFIDFLYNTTDIKTNVKMDFLGNYTPDTVNKNNFENYFTYNYKNFENYNLNLVIPILKNNPFICSDNLFINWAKWKTFKTKFL